MLILLYLYEQNEFGFSDSIWIKKKKMKTFLWFPATEKSWVVSRDTRAPFCYHVIKNNQ